MYEVGTRVRIKVNYLSELDEDRVPLWEVDISYVEPDDDLCYYIEELNLWFSESEVELINEL